MKELKEIKLEDLSPRQKLGMSMISLITKKDPAKVEYVLEMIRNHSGCRLGQPYDPGTRGTDSKDKGRG